MQKDDEGVELSIRDIIGDELYLKFVEAFAGRRLFVPQKSGRAKKIAAVIGEEAANALGAIFGPDIIRVPLSREFRCAAYVQKGFSNGQIATLLGITEPSVTSIIRRLGIQRNKLVPKPANDNRKARLIKGAGSE